jgi:hypothetical protein
MFKSLIFIGLMVLMFGRCTQSPTQPTVTSKHQDIVAITTIESTAYPMCYEVWTDNDSLLRGFYLPAKNDVHFFQVGDLYRLKVTNGVVQYDSSYVVRDVDTVIKNNWAITRFYRTDGYPYL